MSTWKDKIEEEQQQNLAKVSTQQQNLESALNGVNVATPSKEDIDWTNSADYQDAAKYLDDFTKQYGPKALTPEEQAKRSRAAMAVQGVGALGNVANALSNLIYTGKGAPVQTLPKNVDASAAIGKMEEEERAKRNEIYQTAKERIARKQAEADAKAKAAQQTFSNQMAANNLTLSKLGHMRQNYMFTPQMTSAINAATSSGYKAMADRYAPEQAQANLQGIHYNNVLNRFKADNMAAQAKYADLMAQNAATKSTNDAINSNPYVSIATGHKGEDGKTVYVPNKVPAKKWNDMGFVAGLAGILGIGLDTTSGIGPEAKTTAKPLAQLQAEVAAKLAEPGNAEKVASLLADEWDGE